jgi:uncharacterized protein YndB with AHSA1/START domain
VSSTELRLSHVPTVKVGMLIRKPPGEVFQAVVDPDITTRFWFTRSSGKLTPGATVRWHWEMYDASATVRVKEVEDDRRLVFDWGDGAESTTVEFRFTPWEDDATYVEVTESGLRGDGDEVLTRAAGSTGGFTIALCALKALLEHGVALTAVGDRYPKASDLLEGQVDGQS